MRAGDHIYTRRASFTHHGIYIGNKHVIHYTGLSNSIEAGPIGISTLAEFKSGRKVAVKVIKGRRYSREQIVARAYNRIGEDSYDFLTDNCEHFANWCVSGLMEAEVDGQALRAGDHLVATRSLYTHHGIYIGKWKVIHYAGLAGDVKAGPIEVTSLAEFAAGARVKVRRDPGAYSRAEIVARAYSRLGEGTYHWLSNNCEAFATWCVTGSARSAQVRTLGISTLLLG